MTKVLRLAAVASVCLLAGSASAQGSLEPAEGGAPGGPEAPSYGRPRNTITINPLPLVVGMISGEFERAANDRVSIYVAPTYWNLSFGPDDDEFEIFSYGLGFGARYFMAGIAPEGFWIAPGVEVAYAGAEYNGASGSSIAWGAGAQLGYTWLIGDVFDISLGIGAIYENNEVEVEYEEAGIERTKVEGYAGIRPSLRFALGAAF